MSIQVRTVSLAVGLLLLTACASTVPPSRMADYLGPQAITEPPGSLLPVERPIHAGLVVIADASAPDAAPSPPDEAVSRLAQTLQEQISRHLPIAIDKILPADDLKPTGDIAPFRELGKRYGVEYLAVAVLSSTEQEYPIYVFLGWTTHMQPGFRRDNWSLIEVALIDVDAGRSLLHAEVRAWATLDSPSAPGINQWYPVVYLRPQDPERRVWPPTFEGAPNTLRVVSLNQAAKRLILSLQDAWLHKRRTEVNPVQG